MDALTESLRLHNESLRIRNSIKAGSPDLSLDRFRTIIGRWNKTVGDDPPGPLFKGVVTEHNVRLAAKNSAELVHAVMQRRHAESDASTPIDQAESAFEDVLSMLRTSARTQSRTLTARAFEILVDSVVDAAVTTPAAVEKGGSCEAALEAVRAYHLLHRICAVVAAIPGIQLRQMENRGRSSLAGVAARRWILRNPGLPVDFPVVTKVADHAPGDRVALVAYAESAKWIDRPERPYTELKLDTGEQLRVHFKNTRRIGIIENHWIWARCKVEEPEEGIHYVVAEFEGPTTSAGECWESWLQVEARDYYDVTPGSMHLFTSNTDNRLDLYSRLATEGEAA